MNDNNFNGLKIGVVGAGSWGTALANLLALKGFSIDLWAFEKNVKEDIANFNENRIFLPGVKLSPNIHPSNDLEKVASGKDLLLLVVPSHVMRETANKISDFVTRKVTIVSASKGIENKTHLTMTGVLSEIFSHIPKNLFAVLSGPSFASEVAKKVPTLVAVASKDQKTAELVQHVFATPYFRVYTSNDITGVELGGATKNVIAIAAGMADGLNFGLNTRAAIITRGLTEIRRLGLNLGANPRTFVGLACVGDLLLTCTGNLSRNYTVGKLLGEGKKIDDILSEMKMVAEGVKTAKSVYNLSQRIGVEMPISCEIYNILYNDISPEEAVHRLMTRELREELDEI
ncbi:MAG: NAD(P)-dependent glycerol-3-phosphate dehydrogenase [Desulfosarcina sp.]|nr:NAD(P)-dependent glycerol-3-phosphate dehydrogenase [Desulfobacterales bacterium]